MSPSYALSPGVNRPFEAQGGLFRDEAIMLLRRFYVQENERGVCFYFFLTSIPRRSPPLFFGRFVVCRPDKMGLLTNDLHVLVYMKIAPEPRPKKNRELVTAILPLSKDSLDTV